MNNQTSRLLPVSLLSGVLLLALGLSGCGVSSVTVGSGPSTGSPSATGQPLPQPTATMPGHIPSSTSQLACQLEVSARPIDDIGETLHCTVSNMPSSQTTFVLHYSVETNAGKAIQGPVCRGTLSGGAGSCTVVFSDALPQAVTRGIVSGSTEPNLYPLGPIIPKQVAGGTVTGTPPPFRPQG